MKTFSKIIGEDFEFEYATMNFDFADGFIKKDLDSNKVVKESASFSFKSKSPEKIINKKLLFFSNLNYDIDILIIIYGTYLHNQRKGFLRKELSVLVANSCLREYLVPSLWNFSELTLTSFLKNARNKNLINLSIIINVKNFFDFESYKRTPTLYEISVGYYYKRKA